MSLKGAEASTVENTGTAPTFGQKLKAHFKKWWWAHLIFFCASVLIITLCLVYVGFPNIAQDNVNDSTLTIKRQTVTNPTPDSVQLHIESISDSDSVFHPALDSFPAALYLTSDDNTDTSSLGPSFGSITIPSTTAGQDVPVTIDQTMKIADKEAFTDYNVQVLKSETFQMLVSGDMTLHEGSFPATTVNYDKIVTMKGLNGLKGLEITKLGVTSESKYNIKGEVTIPNPSVFTIEMGEVTTELFVNDTSIGYNILSDVTLKPGNNTVQMKGHTNLLTLYKFIQGPYKYPITAVPVTIHGNTSTVNGVEIPYYSAALQSNPLKVNLDLSQLS